MTQRAPYPRVGTLSVEAAEPVALPDLRAAEEWQALVTYRGVPCNYLRFPSPGSAPGAGVLNAALIRHADEHAAWVRFVESFRRRLGIPDHEPKRRSCSVVMCTHRRPQYIGDVLRGLRQLDPPADEIVVVDNDPGGLDCRGQAEEAGVRYVREDRRGLDNARNAGLRAARGELIAFTDDDCVPAAAWLRSLPELFDDPMVAAVSGPAFAHALDTPAQARFEDQGGHRRGLHRRAYDWRSITPIAATRAGAGLNMIFRRSALDGLGELFPPELDAGTPTESGGDIYALYKVLRAGYLVVYDPGTYVFHQHRPDSSSLHRAIRGYGIGVTAALTKLLLEERELATPTVWYWLWWLYKDAVGRGLAGLADPVEVRIGWDYLLGGLLGARAWWTSRRRFGANESPPRQRLPRAAPASPAAGAQARLEASEPAVSVVVAAPAPGAEARCVSALSRQSRLDGGLEVIVVHPAGAANGAGGDEDGRRAVRHVAADATLGMKEAGARSARGDLLLFLHAEAVPEEELVAQHVGRHGESDRERLVVGYSSQRAAPCRLAALYESLDSHDHFERKHTAAAMTFADVPGSNVSVRRATYERLGGFDGTFERLEREGWDLGVRALTAGVEVVYEPAAVAESELRTTAREGVDLARRRGHADTLLEERHPVVSPSLPDASRPSLRRHPRLALPILLLERPRARRWAVVALDLLELLKARRLWLRLFELARHAAYRQGVAEGGGRRSGTATPVLHVELGSDEPIPPPAVGPPLIQLTLDGRPVGRVAPAGGQWHRYLADQAAAAAGERLLELPLERPPALEETPRGRDLSGTAVVFGPARRAGDDRPREALEAAGANVEVAEGAPADHWPALDRAIRASREEVVAMPLPGVAAGPSWLSAARPAVGGERIAAAVGAGVAPGAVARPLLLCSRRLWRARYAPPGRPYQYLLVRRALYEELGGFDPATARLGPQGPVMDLLERALDEGYVIGYRETAGLEPANPSGLRRRQAAWNREQARGGLMLRQARGAGGVRGVAWLAWRGLLPLAAELLRSLRANGPSTVSAAGSAAAFLTGCAIAIGERRPRGRPPAPAQAARGRSHPARPGAAPVAPARMPRGQRAP